MDRPAMTTRRRASHRRLQLIFVAADKVGMNRSLNLGLLVLGLLGLLPLRLRGFLSRVAVLGRLLLTNRTDHRVVGACLCWMEKPSRYGRIGVGRGRGQGGSVKGLSSRAEVREKVRGE
jgi:hypothetical protein